MYNGLITDVKGIELGHGTNEEAGTGCTVILCRRGAVGGVDVRGGAPGTRETDLLRPGHLVDRIHAIVLSGGSAFGLDTSCGVMKYLEEQDIGFDAGVAKIPIVCSAVLFDLAYKNASIRPDSNMGYQACQNASHVLVDQGSVGAGTGATIGKVLGMEQAMKGGIGTASLKLPGGVIVGAVAAVNAFGDVVEPRTGVIIAGAKKPGTLDFLGTQAYLLSGNATKGFAVENTTLVVVATNGRLTREQANKLSSVAHNGLALTIRPVHTMFDGDTVFTMATGYVDAEMTMLCTAAVEVVSRAVINAVQFANLVSANRVLEI